MTSADTNASRSTDTPVNDTPVNDTRLDHAPGIDRSRPISFTVDGQKYSGFAGDTIASALIAAGRIDCGNSTYLGRARGILSAGIEESNALVRVRGRLPGDVSESMLPATRVPITEGLEADYLAGLGILDPGQDELVYEHKHAHTDVLIIGAGPAGLAAAREAGKSGARTLLLDDRSASLELDSLDTLVSNDYPDTDIVLMLTEIPRHTRGKPLVAEILPGRDSAVISYPTLGAWTTKSRLLSILLSCVNQLLPYGPTTVAHPYLPKWGRWSDDEGAGQRTLHAHTFSGGPRLVMGMTRANEPFRTAPKLSRAVAAAAATGAFGIFYNSIWQMSSYMSSQRLVAIGLIAIVVMVSWLIASHRLLDKPINEHLATVVLYYNLSTVLTLLIAVAVLYVLLVIGIFLTSLVVIDPEFMGKVLGAQASVGNYLDIAWISAALGVVAGGLGASFDSSMDVKNLTHGRRLRMRVYTEDKDDA